MSDSQDHGARNSRLRPLDAAVSLSWVLAVLLHGRRLILVATTAGFAIAVVVAVLRKPSYTADFSFIPQTSQDQARGGLASLAGQFGLNIGSLGGETQPPQLYADLLETRVVLSAIAKDTVTRADGTHASVSDFLVVAGADPAVVLENTIQKLRESVVTTSVATRTTGAVSVRVRTNSPQASYEITLRLLEGLDQFNRVTRQSQATEERRFTEARLSTARESLHLVEDSLQQFLQSNRQFGDASRLRFDRERLESEVALQRDVVKGLAQQAEEARIREVRDTPVITMIERPNLPAVRDPMRRVRTIVLLTLAGAFLGIVVVLGRAGWERQREDAGDDQSYAMLADEWSQIRKMLRRS